MTLCDDTGQWQEINDEVERRLATLRDEPEGLTAYDQQDNSDWEEIRRIITLEVQTEYQRRRRPARPPEGDGEILRERFELRRELGRGAQGKTYLGFDRRSESKVAVKELILRDIEDWKAIELFEREANILKSLDHRAIPDYIDTFHLSAAEGERFFLVQEFVDGHNFEELIEQGERFDEARAKVFLQEVLEILIYLHDLSPPVIHRDIKPSNIMRRDDGSLVLIDFGAVQSVIPNKQGGSTIIGTSGYMPMEQLMGRAEAATDIYALGATAIHLLSRRHPADLPMEKWQLQFEDFVNISERFVHYLKKMTAPHAEERFTTANQALAALPLPQLKRRSSTDRPSPPASRPSPSPTPTASSPAPPQGPIRSGRREIKQEPAEPTGEAIETLNDRYELHRNIGTSDDHSTYRGYDLHTQTEIVVTEYLFEGIRKATAIDIFNKKKKELLAIDHGAIPTYLDAFFVSSPRGKRYFLVQQFADGQNFGSLLDEGFSFDEDTTRQFVEDMLAILIDLQGLSPPVIHANITPTSVILRPDDSLAVVDFRALWYEIAAHQREPAVVGRAGYTPLDQVGEDFDMSTDLYALGATAMHLMSRRPPPGIPGSRWHEEFERAVDISPEFLLFLKKLTAFEADERFPNAVRAQRALRRLNAEQRSSSPEPDQPPPSLQAPDSAVAGEPARRGLPPISQWPVVNWTNSPWFWVTFAMIVVPGIVFAWPGYILFHDIRAERAIEGGDFEAATEARHTNCRAGAGLACAYLWGVAREVDPELAQWGARQACERGIALGCANLSEYYLQLYLEDRENNRHLRQALDYAQRGCDGESPTGCARQALVELYLGEPDRAQRSAMRSVGLLEPRRHQYLPHMVLAISLLIDGELVDAAHSIADAENSLGNTQAREQPILTVPLERAIVDHLIPLKQTYPDRIDTIDRAITGLK